MATTYEPIASQTLGSDSSTVSFTSIGADWTDLIVVIHARNTNASTDRQIYCRFNGDSGSNYSYTDIRGNGSAVTSNRGSSTTFILSGLAEDADDAYSISVIQVMSYASTSVYKTTLVAGASAGNRVDRTVGLWRDTSAVTSIDLALNGDSYKAGSTFSLFGIKAA